MPRVTISGASSGLPYWDLTSAGEETPRVALQREQIAHIHVTGLTGSTVQIIEYVGSNTTGIAVPYNGSADFTSDFGIVYTAGGKVAIAVKLTVDGVPDLLLENSASLLVEDGFSLIQEG